MNSINWLAKRLSSTRTEKQKIGDAAEEQALLYLESAGLTLVERNFLCKGGEIDLIMRDQGSLVFVEVRKRKNQQFGGALASISPTKQRRMIHAAQVYLSKLKSCPPCRFDVVAIEGEKSDEQSSSKQTSEQTSEQKSEQLKWLKNVIVQ